METVTKIGLLVIKNGAVLLCRKNGLASLILPGGKIKPGEEALDCLKRELREELGEVELVNPRYVGTYSDVMAGDALKTIEVILYLGELHGFPEASSEVDELVWFRHDDEWGELAPSLANKILPNMIDRGMLQWESR